MVVCKQGCGATFKEDGAWRAKHELKCKGKVQTRGRIERLTAHRSNATPAARKKTTRVATNGHTDRTPPETPSVTPAQMLVALRSEAVKIQNAIAAIEALG